MKKFLIRLLPFLLFILVEASAQDVKFAIAELPLGSPTEKKGMYIDFIKAMQKVYKGGKITYTVYPFKRSLLMVKNGNADLHFPILEESENSKSKKNLPFDYADYVVSKVTFGLYTNKERPEVTKENISKYRIETEAAHTVFFDFPTIPSTCVLCSLRKVSSNRIDGFIYAVTEVDLLVKSHKMDNIKAQIFDRYNVKFIFDKNCKRKKFLNNFLNETIDKLKANGEFQRILGKEHTDNLNWKPY